MGNMSDTVDLLAKLSGDQPTEPTQTTAEPPEYPSEVTTPTGKLVQLDLDRDTVTTEDMGGADQSNS